MKRILAVILGLIGLGTVYTLGTPPTIEEQQANYRAQHGKYQHMIRGACNGNVECQVDEYQHPDGSVGYTIHEWRTQPSPQHRIVSHDDTIESTNWIAF
jgi:hypothetical protein